MTFPIFQPADLSKIKPGFPVTPSIIVASTFNVEQAITAYHSVRSLAQFAWDNRDAPKSLNSRGIVLRTVRVMTNPMGSSLRLTLTVRSVLQLHDNLMHVHHTMYRSEYPWGQSGTAHLALLAEQLQFGMRQPLEVN